jgi:molecular chaperone GrpE
MSDTDQTIDPSAIADGADGAGEPVPSPAKSSGADKRPAGHEGRAGDGGSPGVHAPGETPSVPVQDPDEDALRDDVEQLVQVAAQRDEYLALAQRTQADFENYRKRVAREAGAAQERGMATLAKELLPALDNLDRAIDAAAEEDPLLEGVSLVRAELSAGLARAGIESYSPLGEDFDPSLHEAVATAPQPAGGAESGTVVEVYQAGYRLGENIIRPARVVVAA